MDRNFYYQKRAQEHQREISKELATRNLLKGDRSNLPATKGLKRLVLLGTPTLIALTILFLLHFLG